MEKHRIRPVLKLFIPTILILIFLVLMLVVGFIDFQNNKKLDTEAKTVSATATEWRTTQIEVGTTRPYSKTQMPIHYELRYNFTLPGDTASYSCGDGASGDNNFWCWTEYNDWLESQTSGHIDVSYLAEKPEINRPLHIPGGGTNNSIGGLSVMGGILMLIIVWICFQYYWATKDPTNSERKHFLWRSRPRGI